MQRQVLHGVPYFTDKQNRLYLWDTETEPCCVGTYEPSTDTIQLDDRVVSSLGPRLQEWRQKQNSRPRKSSGGTTSKRRGDSSNKGNEASDSADDE